MPLFGSGQECIRNSWLLNPSNWHSNHDFSTTLQPVGWPANLVFISFLNAFCVFVILTQSFSVEYAPLRFTFFSWSFNLLKPTGHVIHHQFNIQQLYAVLTLYLFVFIWEKNSDLCHLSINWLVFITEMKSVYCAVRTGSLNKAVCALSVKVWTAGLMSCLCTFIHKGTV